MGAVSTRLIEWAAASRALESPGGSGDQYLVGLVPNGMLLAVADGLGHGIEAELAAETALGVLREHAEEPVIALFNRCHRRLRTTRGVVLSVALFHAVEGAMTWLGVGNVEGILLRADPAARPRQESLLLRAGVVGAQLPQLQGAILSVSPGDTLILATDGVRSDFARDALADDPPQRTADRILSQYSKGNDDALVLVARYLGGAA
jgi:negative regulator of sigma-B (phosphoserine phosphatase)